MSDKFHVGQPVWAISRWDASWWAGVVREAKNYMITAQVFVYGVEIPTLAGGDRGGTNWSVEDQQLRPRDPDQFTRADEAFEWNDCKETS